MHIMIPTQLKKPANITTVKATPYTSKVKEFISTHPRLKKDLYNHLKKLVNIKINKNSIKLPDRAIYISNHPKLASEFHVGTDTLPEEGRKYPLLHFPGIFQAAWYELISADSTNQFVTAIKSIGYDKVMEDIDCFVLPDSGGVNAVSEQLLNATNKSLVIYPEGKCNNISSFKHGFYHVAIKSKISEIIVCHISEEPQLGGELNINLLDKIHVPNFGDDEKSLNNWVESIRMKVYDFNKKK